MRRLMLLSLVVACDNASAPGGAGPASAGIASVSSAGPASAPAPVAAPVTTAAPLPINARALFDEAMRAELNGDALEARDLWIRLAAQAPESPQGRYAVRAASGGDLMALAMVAGMLSAVAIPSFMQYQQRAKTSEATIYLSRLDLAAVNFYHTEMPAQEGIMPAARFPMRTELTPGRSACIDGSPVAHTPDPTLWEGQGWRELGFAIDDPFYYQYQYLAEGEGNAARFTVRAIGDLDCDGVFSTFERTGSVDEFGSVIRGEQTSKNELE